MKDVLAFIGILTIITLIMFSMVLICEALMDIYDKAYRDYRIKHRFDKPPVAKCYCVDCVWYSGHGYCNYSEGCGDACFCWRAEPRKEIKE